MINMKFTEIIYQQMPTEKGLTYSHRMSIVEGKVYHSIYTAVDHGKIGAMAFVFEIAEDDEHVVIANIRKYDPIPRREDALLVVMKDMFDFFVTVGHKK